MKSIVKRLQRLPDTDLFSLSEAIDLELDRRSDVTGEVLDSARRRAVERQQGYRRRIGSNGVPVKATGMGRAGRSDPCGVSRLHGLKLGTDLLGFDALFTVRYVL